MKNPNQFVYVDNSRLYFSIRETLAHKLIKKWEKRFSTNEKIFVMWHLSCVDIKKSLVDLKIVFEKRKSHKNNNEVVSLKKVFISGREIEVEASPNILATVFG